MDILQETELICAKELKVYFQHRAHSGSVIKSRLF